MRACMTICRLRIAGVGIAGMLATVLLAPSPAGAFFGYPSGPSVQFGEAGSGNGQFSSPIGIAVDEASSDVYVTDQGNGRVQKFSAEGAYISQFTGGETPAGSLSSPTAVAVDNASGPGKGDVYVADVGHKAVDVFDSSGKYLSQIAGTPSGEFSEIEGVAINPAGDLWVYDSSNVDQFTAAGSFVSSFNTGRGTAPGLAVDSANNVYLLFACGCIGKYDHNGSQLGEWGSGVALAVDPASNDLLVDKESSVEDYGPFGEPFSSPAQVFATEGLSASRGLAVNGLSGAVYATSTGENKVAIFNPAVLPDVATGEATGITIAGASLHGTFDAEETKAKYYFEYGLSTSYGSATVPISSEAGSLEAVGAAIEGLEPFATYHYRLVAENENGVHYGDDHELKTLAVPPTVEAPGGTVSDASRTHALLHASINSRKASTTYYYEYGETTGYGSATHPTELAFSEGATTALDARAIATELKPHTIYHFRVVATNSGGTTFGPDVAFTSGNPTPPVVQTGGVSGITPSGATIAGTVATQGLITAFGFRVGISPADLGPLTGLGSVGAGFSEAGAQLELSGLQPNTTYYYTIVGESTDGKSEGEIRSFTTGSYPSPNITVTELRLLSEPFVSWPDEVQAKSRKFAVKVKVKTKHRKAKKHRRKPKKKK